MTFKQSPQYKRYHYLLRRYVKSRIQAEFLMASRPDGIITPNDREYQAMERSRVALDSFIVANLQLLQIKETSHGTTKQRSKK